MVFLNRIYTRSGDAGETSLGDGTRVPKTHRRITAYGTVDELNAVIGVVIAACPDSADEAARLRLIQNDLFDLGADLCVPESDQPAETPSLRVTAAQVTQLEEWIDIETERLTPLTSFILPGGTAVAAGLHHARTVCRRAEIAVQYLADDEAINPQTTIYLNRLSDLLFVMARASNDGGQGDILWVPGGKRS